MKTTPILIAGFVLGAFSVAGVGLVAVTHAMTDGQIAENQRNAMLNKLEAIVPSGRLKNDPLADRIEVSAPELLGGETTEVFRVRDGAEPVALILQPVVPDGYAGPIRLLVSALPDGTLGGVRVLEHHETPGLGDKIDEKKSDWIIKEFTGKSIGNPPAEQWHVKRDGGVFDQFTGATITPRSIVEAVYDTLLYVGQQEQRLYAEPAIGTEDSAPPQAATDATDPPRAEREATPAAAPTPDPTNHPAIGPASGQTGGPTTTWADRVGAGAS
ncbi:electron transport complex subunit RsxG [Thiorhodovibrio frisius]|uniref:Ion-translocating oxidoreductase complex subunit G n=1 Tax=Thiorhodovibrio frisius TaxID=631362 RepID=H8YXB4_9GAMM|nr:electron transport complex subunit RsxG [Thiorhodovibrio frisius]EIC23090.1 electron transport complex, RnfABCDGE type, G subunit [Thiorhodovibrio frisius]WPL22646.1 Nitrogen fixation protein RnfG [Thiorhodovibrio frisius]